MISSIDVALFLLILLVAYFMHRMWKVLGWIIRHVQVVSKRDQEDPEMTRIKQIFNVPGHEQKGDGK